MPGPSRGSEPDAGSLAWGEPDAGAPRAGGGAGGHEGPGGGGAGGGALPGRGAGPGPRGGAEAGAAPPRVGTAPPGRCRRRRHEPLQVLGGPVAPAGAAHPAAQGLALPLLRRDLGEEPGPVRPGLHHPLPRPAHQLHLPLQHRHEGGVHRLFLRHRLAHLQQVQGHLRRQPRHLPRGVPAGARRPARLPRQPRLHPPRDPVDLLHLPGGGGHPAAALPGEQDGRGGDHHQPLPVRPGPLPGALPGQLAVALPRRGLLRPHRRRGRPRADRALLRLLLPVHHQSPQGEEAEFTCVAPARGRPRAEEEEEEAAKASAPASGASRLRRAPPPALSSAVFPFFTPTKAGAGPRADTSAPARRPPAFAPSGEGLFAFCGKREARRSPEGPGR